MKSQTIKIIGLLITFNLSMGLGMSYAQTSGAGKAEQFYRGKNITWVVASEPGSGPDVFARILAPYLVRETGAKVVVKNMAGGSVEGDNWVYNEAKRDGLTILTDGAGPLLFNDLLKSPGVKYETKNFSFVAGGDPTFPTFSVSPKLPYKTLNALRKANGLKVGATSARGHLAIAGAVCLEILGLDGKVITGYQGLKSVQLALAQGEMDITVAADQEMARAERQGSLIPLFVLSDEGSSQLPNIPTMRGFGVNIPEAMLDAKKTVESNCKAIVLPPGVPEDRVIYLRRIFKKISEIKDFQTTMSKWAGAWHPFIPGEKMQKDIDQLMSNKSLSSQLEALFKKYSSIK